MLKRILSLILIFLSLGQESVRQMEDQLSLGGNLFLVNKEYMIGADYVPDDLVMPDVKKSSSAVLMRKEAAQALEEMFAACREETKAKLISVSGYRAWSRQNNIYKRKLRSVGNNVAKAQEYVAPPGASEHQLGLAMDIGQQDAVHLNEKFRDTVGGKWVAQNCWRFGFILRYGEEWEEVTGYKYEPWHFR
jgi:D-alanyl-D-alanine carboxypeptidase